MEFVRSSTISFFHGEDKFRAPKSERFVSLLDVSERATTTYPRVGLATNKFSGSKTKTSGAFIVPVAVYSYPSSKCAFDASKMFGITKSAVTNSPPLTMKPVAEEF